MIITHDNRAILIVILTMAAFNGIFLSANGLFMLVVPQVWYDLVPGVTDTGFYNQHFVHDIGLIQLFLGVAFGIGMFRSERRIELWAAATSWLTAHAASICGRSPSESALRRQFPAIFPPSPCPRSLGWRLPSGRSIPLAPREPHLPEATQFSAIHVRSGKGPKDRDHSIRPFAPPTRRSGGARSP